LGEQAYLKLKEIAQAKSSTSSSDRTPSASTNQLPTKPTKDLYVLLRHTAAEDIILGKLWKEVNTVPPWVRGFFNEGSETSAVVSDLYYLGGSHAHYTSETTQYILQCTRSLNSIKPGGEGHAASIRVRLLHAAVRQKIMTLTEQRPSYYDLEKWGIPINDLDCIATITTFSATLIWLSLPRQGIWMTSEEVEDYTALWRYVAYLLGTPTNSFESPEKAKRMMQVLLLYEVQPTSTSRILASNVLKSLKDQPPSFASMSFLEVNARWLNGNRLADELGIGCPSLYYWALMTGQCLFFMSLIYTYRSIPWLDRSKIKALRNIFWQLIVESKTGLGQETTFDFKYIPDFSKTTNMGDAPETCNRRGGIERLNLQVFVIGCFLFGLFGFVGLKIGYAMGRRVAATWM
ncbi:MAG: hypothetical protein Q9217_000793, partial [Psora testacea]